METDPDNDRDTTGGPFDVLVLLTQPRNERLLIEWLDEGVVENCAIRQPDDPTRAIEDGAIDLCILDPPMLQRHAAGLRERKARIAPEYLPCLLVVPRNTDTTRADNRSIWAQLGDDGDLIDELIRTPIRKGELAQRLQALLRARAMSVDLGTREEQYRQLVELTPEAIVLIDDGDVIYVNDSGRTLFGGIDPDPALDIIGRPIVEFIAEQDRETVIETIDRIESEGTAGGFIEVEVQSPSGQLVKCELNGVQVTYGGSLATQLVFRDLTERRKREQQLRLFGRAVNEANQGISIVDANQPDQPLIYVNSAFERITGYTTSEALGRNCRFLQGEATDPETIATIRAAIDAERPVSVEIRNYRQDGTVFWNQLDITPVKDETGSVTHYIGLQRDITARKEREEELKRYETVMQTAGDPIFVLDSDYRFTSVNDALTELFGEPRETLLGADANQYLEPGALDQLREAIETFNRDPTTDRTVEIPIMTAGNETRYAEISLAPLPTGDEDDPFRGIVGVVRDVTEQRRRQQRLAVLERVLRHNLRNEMNVVMGYTAEIRRMTDDVDAIEGLENIETAAKRLLEMADEVRQFRDAIETQSAELSSMDLTVVVTQAIQTITDEYPSATVTTALPECAPVYATTSLDLIVTELLENAIIHNDTAHPRIEVTVNYERETESQWVELRVADNGSGIPESVQELIEHGEETPLEHLSGLGLWLVRWTVEQSGGDLQFEDNDHGGTTVVVRLHGAPATESPDAEHTIP